MNLAAQQTTRLGKDKMRRQSRVEWRKINAILLTLSLEIDNEDLPQRGSNAAILEPADGRVWLCACIKSED